MINLYTEYINPSFVKECVVNPPEPEKEEYTEWGIIKIKSHGWLLSIYMHDGVFKKREFDTEEELNQLLQKLNLIRL